MDKQFEEMWKEAVKTADNLCKAAWENSAVPDELNSLMYEGGLVISALMRLVKAYESNLNKAIKYYNTLNIKNTENYLKWELAKSLLDQEVVNSIETIAAERTKLFFKKKAKEGDANESE